MRILITILSLLILVTAGHADEPEWSLARDKEGIKIYTRKFADYNYKEYKGIAVMDGDVQELVDLLKDINHYCDWSYNCVENSPAILKQADSRGEYYIYMEIKAPIVSNRDVITLYKFHPVAPDGSVLVEFWGDADFLPKKKGLIRIPELIGYWKATPVDGGKFKVVHQAFSHPGGSPPAGLVNSQNVNAPFYMLKKIREIIEE